MTTRVQNPMTSGGGGGGCPWTCETPCVAEMFQKCAEYFDNAGLPPIPDSIPYVGAMAFRARKKGPAGRGGAKDLSDRMAAVAMGQPGEDLREEANLLEQLGALGWDEYPWSDVRTQVPQLAAFLRSKGLERGDRLCLFADAGPEWSLIFYACQYVGIGVCVREPRMPIAEVPKPPLSAVSRHRDPRRAV